MTLKINVYSLIKKVNNLNSGKNLGASLVFFLFLRVNNDENIYKY